MSTLNECISWGHLLDIDVNAHLDDDYYLKTVVEMLNAKALHIKLIAEIPAAKAEIKKRNFFPGEQNGN